MPEKINVEQLLQLRKTIAVVDTRSEGEYEHAHIPGAKNLPLLNNDERAKVGTCYKQKGREEAVLLGFDLVGHKFGDYIRKAKELSKNPTQPSPQGRALSDGNSPLVGELEGVVIYCWRGGLRSNTMAWLLEKAGMNVYVLEGGYKTFRHWVLEEFNKPLDVLVLGGKTGSGKTYILNEIKKQGEQFIDLEEIAHHRGSSFGALGQPAQTSTEQFENLLALELLNIDRTKTLWLENESSKIGTVKIPDSIFYKMRSAQVVEIEVPLEKRVQNIINDYAAFPKEKLVEATKRIERKLGNKAMNEALNFLEEKDYFNWIKILLNYYDKAYNFSRNKRQPDTIFPVEISENDHAEAAEKVIAFSRNIKRHAELISASDVDKKTLK